MSAVYWHTRTPHSSMAIWLYRFTMATSPPCCWVLYTTLTNSGSYQSASYHRRTIIHRSFKTTHIVIWMRPWYAAPILVPSRLRGPYVASYPRSYHMITTVPSFYWPRLIRETHACVFVSIPGTYHSSHFLSHPIILIPIPWLGCTYPWLWDMRNPRTCSILFQI